MDITPSHYNSQPKAMLQDLPYSVLGFGDVKYKKFNTFCIAGVKIDKRMEELGAKRCVDCFLSSSYHLAVYSPLIRILQVLSFLISFSFLHDYNIGNTLVVSTQFVMRTNRII